MENCTVRVFPDLLFLLFVYVTAARILHIAFHLNVAH